MSTGTLSAHQYYETGFKISYSTFWGTTSILFAQSIYTSPLPEMSAPFTVFAFLIGTHGHTGPRLISVHRKEPNSIHPIIKRCMFPDDAEIRCTQTIVKGRHYCIYFDHARHLHDSATASYLFIRMLYPGRPINICAEDDLPDIIQALKK